VDGFFEGLGQHAFVGFAPPEGPEPEVVLSVWPPANWAPTDLENSVVRFSVLMRIVDSTTEDRDDFRWSAYNSDAQRLFTIDFDNLEQSVNYALDDGEFVSTGLGFDNQGFYELVVHMNFVRNLWSATLNGIVIANSLEITTTGAALNLGDVDAVWAIRSPERPGDNFLVFDNYLIAIASTGSIPPVLESLNMVNGNYQFRLYGEEDLDYRIEVSNDLREWFTLGTFTAPAGGIFDFEDTTAPEYRTGFYRVRQVD
jgi:hypothetical protein